MKPAKPLSQVNRLVSLRRELIGARTVPSLLCNQTIEDSNRGEMDIVSVPGEGTRVTVRLPRQQVPSADNVAA